MGLRENVNPMVYIERILDSELAVRPAAAAAPVYKRLFNFLIDFFVGGTILSILVGMLGGLVLAFSDQLQLLDVFRSSVLYKWIFTILVMVLYYSGSEFLFDGKTLGKYITATRVVRIDGQPLSFQKVLVRSLARFIPFESISFLLQLQSKKPGGWHDHLTQTIVVEDYK